MRHITKWLGILLLVEGASTPLFSQPVTLSWNASEDPTVTNYTAEWGTCTCVYGGSQNTGTNTSVTITNFTPGKTYYLAVTATDSLGIQSPRSIEVKYTMPGPAAAFTFSNLTQTYSAAPQGVSVSVNPTNVAFTLTYNGSSDPPVNAGAYTVVATAQSPATGGATNTLVINAAPATVNLCGLTATYTGSCKTAGSSTIPAGLCTAITYNGSTTAPVNAGTYEVVSSITDSNYTGSATGTLVISPNQTAQVMLYALNQIYDGTPKSVGVTTVPCGLAVTVSYNVNGVSAGAAPVNEGAYTVVATISDPNYSGGATNTFNNYDPANALVLSWPAGAGNPAISASADLATWLPLAVNIGPTNQLVVPKQPGNQFFRGPNLQIVDPSL
jgi:hypothetical protein